MAIHNFDTPPHQILLPKILYYRHKIHDPHPPVTSSMDDQYLQKSLKSYCRCQITVNNGKKYTYSDIFLLRIPV
jgi:hypothetical protein